MDWVRLCLLQKTLEKKSLLQQSCNEWLCPPYKRGTSRSYQEQTPRCPAENSPILTTANPQGVAQDGQTNPLDWVWQERSDPLLPREGGLKLKLEQEILEGGRSPRPWQGGWNWIIFKVPSNPFYDFGMILH